MLKILEAKEEFDSIVENNGNVIVDFFATWCSPCRHLGEVFHELAEENENVTILKVDVDKFPEIAQRFNVYSIPQVNIFKGGKEVHSFVGYRDKNAINELIGKLF